jgi:acetolactate synthase-1/2/3 large subunit
MQKSAPFENVSQALLELLALRGIECFFANPGTEFASIEDGFARRLMQGLTLPRPVTVPHEIPLMSMAHGYYLAVGKPQAAMVHVGVGTGNAMGPLMAASRGRVPVLFMAGRTPVTEQGSAGSRTRFIHWAQESYDQAAMLREYVKWDYELRNPSQLESVLDRAITIAMAEPRGPVYLVLPRELLSSPFHGTDFRPQPRFHLPTNHPAAGEIEEAVGIMAEARFPLIITSSIGRSPSAVQALVELAESGGVGVVSFNPEYMNFPLAHPCHQGFDPHPLLEEADALFVIDCDVPWYPFLFNPPDPTPVVQMGIDPLYARYPIRTFPSDLTVQGSPELILPRMAQLMISRNPEEGRIQERKKRLQRRHDRLLQGWHEDAQRSCRDTPLDSRWVSHQVARALGEETVVFNEHDLGMKELISPGIGRFFGTTHVGYLGWAMGAALGYKMARPEELVTVTIGDGCYMLGVPASCHFVSSAYSLPVLFIVYNNRCYHAVKRATRSAHPQGWAAQNGCFPLSDFKGAADYEKVCQAFGGYGERVESPDQVGPALDRALHAVRNEKRQALLNMIVRRP